MKPDCDKKKKKKRNVLKHLGQDDLIRHTLKGQQQMGLKVKWFALLLQQQGVKSEQCAMQKVAVPQGLALSLSPWENNGLYECKAFVSDRV